MSSLARDPQYVNSTPRQRAWTTVTNGRYEIAGRKFNVSTTGSGWRSIQENRRSVSPDDFGRVMDHLSGVRHLELRR